MARRVVELIWIWARPCGGLIAGILVVEHVGMRIVLLFCTHGINLGRTKFYRKKGEGDGGGQLAELLVVSLKRGRIIARLGTR